MRIWVEALHLFMEGTLHHSWALKVGGFVGGSGTNPSWMTIAKTQIDS